MCKTAGTLLSALITLFLASSLSFGQDPGVLYSEEFLNNQRQWPEMNDMASLAKVKSGYYLIRNRHNEQRLILDIPVMLNTDSNFVIETTLKRKSGIRADGFGLAWGSNEEGYACSFTISANGSYEIGKWEDNKWQYRSRGNFNAIEKGNKFNTLTIKKIGTNCFFYVNKQLIIKIKSEKLKGNRVGFILYNRLTVLVDKIIVKGISTKKSSNLSNAIAIAPDSLNTGVKTKENSGFISKETEETNAAQIDSTEKTDSKNTDMKPKEAIDTAKTRKDKLIVPAKDERPKTSSLVFENEGSILIDHLLIDDRNIDIEDFFLSGNNNGSLNAGESVRVCIRLINNANVLNDVQLRIQALGIDPGFILTGTDKGFSFDHWEQADTKEICFGIYLSKQSNAPQLRLQLKVKSEEGVVFVPFGIRVTK